jgi:hypothetical protein
MTGNYKYYPHSNQIENAEHWFELKPDRNSKDVLNLCQLVRKPGGGLKCTYITKIHEEPDLTYRFRLGKQAFMLELFEDNTATISLK